MPQRALVVSFIGDTKSLEAAFKRTSASMNTMQATGQKLSSTGSSLTRGLTLPIVGLGVAAGVASMKFQQSMEQLHTQAGVSQRAVGQLSREVLNMAGSVGTGPQELAQGMYHVASSLNSTLPKAQRVSTEMKVLRTAAEGARVGNANLVDVTNALDAAVVSGIKGVQNYSQAMGALNATVGAGDMTTQDLANALGTGALAPMKRFGLALKDVGGALAVFGDNNIRGEDAATKLTSAVRIMGAPSKQAAKELAGIGLSTLRLADDMRSGGLVKALSDLQAHLKASGMTASEQALVISRAFGGRQSMGVQVLLGQLDRLKAKTKEIGAGAAGFGAAWDATTHTAAFKVQSGLATMKADLIRFGDDVLPPLLKIGSTVVNDVDKVAKAFTSLPKGAQQAIITGGIVLAGIGPAMKVLGLFTSGIGRLWALATRIEGMRIFTSTPGGLGGGLPGRAVSSSVGTMQVGTLVARTTVGGPGSRGTPPIAGGAGPAVTSSVEEASLFSRIRAGVGRAIAGGLRGVAIGGIGVLLAQGIGASIHGSVGRAIKTIGTDTAIGAGIGAMFGPAGIAGGAIIGGLVGTFSHFISNDAEAEGKRWAAKFTSSLPGALSRATKKGLQNAATADSPPRPGSPVAMTRNPRLVLLPGEKADPVLWKRQWEKSFNDVFNFAYTFGKRTGDAFAQAMHGVKFPTPRAILGQVDSVLNAVPANIRKSGPMAVQIWRNEAAKQMLAYASGLESHGRLPRGAVNRMIVDLRRQFGPGLIAYLTRVGMESKDAITNSMNLTAAKHNLGSALNSFRKNWDFTWQFARSTNANLRKNTATAMADLKVIIAHGTKDQRIAAMREYNLLASQSGKVWQYIVNTAAGAMAAAVQSVTAATASMSNSILGVLGIHSKFKGQAGPKPQPYKPQMYKVAPYHAPSTKSAGGGGGGSGNFTDPASAKPVSAPMRYYHHHPIGHMTTAQYQAWLAEHHPFVGSGGGSGTARATMRYYHHKPIGKMTEAQYQAFLAAHSKAAVSQKTAASVPPSQTVAAQIQMAALANQLQVAQNDGNIPAQQKALNAELKLEKLLMMEDKRRLSRITRLLKDRKLSASARSKLEQARLAILQEIGTVAGDIGSAMSSLAGLSDSGSSGSFDLAPTGASIRTPTLYDVRGALGPGSGRHAGIHKGITPEHRSTNHNTIILQIKPGDPGDMKKFADAFADVTGAQLTGELQAAGLI